ARRQRSAARSRRTFGSRFRASPLHRRLDQSAQTLPRRIAYDVGAKLPLARRGGLRARLRQRGARGARRAASRSVRRRSGGERGTAMMNEVHAISVDELDERMRQAIDELQAAIAARYPTTIFELVRSPDDSS